MAIGKFPGKSPLVILMVNIMPERAYKEMEVVAMNKKIILSMVAGLLSFAAIAQIVDTYSFTMKPNVPRVYNNMESLGYRRYQPQTLKGELLFIYAGPGETVVKVKGLYNKTHKVNGKPVTYECEDWPYEDKWVLVVGVGSNKTLKFTQGGASFAFVASPSYNISDILNEDNTLMLELSGHGKLKGDILKTLRGSVRGKMGCSCMDFGHTSPTRLFLGYLTSYVHDVAPVDGTFSASFKKRYIGPVDVDNL